MNRIPWFLAGLGLPLLGLALGFSSRENRTEPAVEMSVREVAIPETIAQPPELLPQPVAPEPAGERIDLVVRSGDTLDQLFKTNDLNRSDLARIMQVPEAKKNLRKLYPGDTITVVHEEGKVSELGRRINETTSLLIKKADDGYAAEFFAHPVEKRTRHTHGRIDSSLFLAGKAAGLSDPVVMKLAGTFAWDIDFVLDIRTGDEFTVIYEEVWQEGEYLRDGEIIAAEFINRGEQFRAARFEYGNSLIGYFTPEGRNVRKAFIRAPIALSPRVTSNFNPRRRHPVLKTTRPHRGVDYGAPTGTHIKAAGDGKVIFRGRKGSYGNAIILQHGGNITTLYAHMSKYANGTGGGKRVKQGQTIGYVGRTCLAWGPHLHYEYRINGVHRNPRTVKLPDAAPVEPAYRADFIATAKPLWAQLDVIRQTQLASVPAGPKNDDS